ncbi:MAG TPA: glycoside hydrolase family 3 N-terminal domain-containing protein [Methylocella sp.]|nr:glycoside hydrolase family 3 N-terminal domain-containing protein [Methylocella sp.]
MTSIDELLSDMTIEEKIGQLTMAAAARAVTGPVLAKNVTEGIEAGRIGSLLNIWGAAEVQAVQKIAVEKSRLGIPLLIGNDVLHGHTTIFPIPLAEAAIFDPSLWERSARAAAAEAAADGVDMTFAPMLDVARDPRWGRIAESPGEDPYVAAQFATAKVRGFQGAGCAGGLAAADSVAATAKHFCAYGAALAGRDYASADVPESVLHEIYIPPFAAAIRAGCAAIMPAFNDVAGIPMTVHAALLRGWLREKIGFDGVMISDYNAIAELLRHGVADDLTSAAAAALRAGVDIDMMSGAYSEGLPKALSKGLVTLDMVDEAVRRVLTLKERLGLFAEPFKRCAAAKASAAPREGRKLARELARRAIVLLTNDGTLPLAADLRRLALAGPLADAPAEMLGPWAMAGRVEDAVSFREGLSAALPETQIAFAPGVEISGSDTSAIPGALELCRSADVIVLCLGEAAHMSGEAASRACPGLPGAQGALAEAVLSLGKPVAVLLSSGRPLTVLPLIERANAVLATWFLGAEAGHAAADVLTGRFNPTGRLPVTWPRDVGQVPIFFASRPTGRPADPNNPYSSKYLDMPVDPLFHFGHGLSFCRFKLSNLRASKEVFWPGEELAVEASVYNEGPAAGEETVFLFVRDLVASVARPLLELKGIAKIALLPGESGTVRFKLGASAFSFPGPHFEPVLEPGDFQISVGQSADPRRLLSIKVRAAAG